MKLDAVFDEGMSEQGHKLTSLLYYRTTTLYKRGDGEGGESPKESLRKGLDID